jgi:hypothetical protein
MQFAMGVRGIEGSNLWERLLHTEATDPYFFLTSEEQLRRVWRFGHEYMRTSTQWYLLKQLREMYSAKNNRARELLWGVRRVKNLERKIERIRRTVSDMIGTGFANYDPLIEL